MYKRILVPLDGSDISKLTLDAAIHLARLFRGRLCLAHVLGEPVGPTGHGTSGRSDVDPNQTLRRWSEEMLKRCLKTASATGVEASMMLLNRPGLRLGEGVSAAAKLWSADLIVVGTHGRKGFNQRTKGSGAEQVIRLASVSVLVIRGPDIFSKDPT